MEQTIMSYRTGEILGEAVVDMEYYRRCAQWPEGVILAKDLLGEEDIERLGIEPEEVLFVNE